MANTTDKDLYEAPERPQTPSEPMKLDDARRIKVLSPGMLVLKRFIRNKLAVVGLIIIAFMFIFAFFGPLLSPYTQTQQFTGLFPMSKDYASATYNTELRYTAAEGESFNSAAIAQFLLALGKDKDTFLSGESEFTSFTVGEDGYRINRLNLVATVLNNKVVTPVDGFTAPAGFVDAAAEAAGSRADSFVIDDIEYRVTAGTTKIEKNISVAQDIVFATTKVFDPFNVGDKPVTDSFEFRLAAAQAMADGQTSFEANDQEFTLVEGEGQMAVLDSAGSDFAVISNIIVNPLDKATFLSAPFKSAAREAIDDRHLSFEFAEQGTDPVEYKIVRVNAIYNIKQDTPTELLRIYEPPTSEHLLGLDNNGMDLLTRLMYGGRISLLVGFVVVFFEIIIGVIIGGISGYFGGWVDTSLMRFVDLFNSIPFYPIVIIFGSVMDTMQVDPMARIFLLMLVLGLLGWTGIARVVRGQILSLREQDFMVATEATGIRTSRKIFRHLVPNVMPLLIVSATGGLGGVIISEATLGFLGLGVKYPLASWGSIINTASDAYVMTNFWFMWIPAGLLILLTVLGFNFVGDGLRDAYDPKMKR